MSYFVEQTTSGRHYCPFLADVLRWCIIDNYLFKRCVSWFLRGSRTRLVGSLIVSRVCAAGSTSSEGLTSHFLRSFGETPGNNKRFWRRDNPDFYGVAEQPTRLSCVSPCRAGAVASQTVLFMANLRWGPVVVGVEWHEWCTNGCRANEVGLTKVVWESFRLVWQYYFFDPSNFYNLLWYSEPPYNGYSQSVSNSSIIW